MATKVKAGAKKVEKKPKGRPSIYSKALCERICELIATSDKGLQQLCNSVEWMPSKYTILQWLIKYEDFQTQYTCARARQADTLIDQIVEIADDSSQDTIYTEKGEIFNAEFAARSKIRIDARKWLASKLAPKKYGDKLDVTTDGKEISSTVVISPFDKK